MAFTIPSTKSIADANVARYEAKINQNAPLVDKAFIRVQSVVEAIIATGHYKLGVSAAKQNLALTADFDALVNLGTEYGVPYKYATAANLTVETSATGGVQILQSNVAIGDSNGVRYPVDADATESGGVIVNTITAETTGVIGNLEIGDTGSWQTGVSGASRQWSVTAINQLGTEDEDIEVYRARVLAEIRTVGGGGNAVDYRRWAEAVEGVLRAYPYAGNPTGPTTSVPGERTVYVEAQTALDPDGIASTALLATVRDEITTDPVTGLARQPLGMTDETLYVESITRTTFDVTITGLVVDASKETAAKAEITTELDRYFRASLPFVDGVDVPADRNDTITAVTVSTSVQGVLTKYGATAQGVTLIKAAAVVVEYLLSQGEMAKLGTVNYV
jgi:uncharacterized phage protein gp47/JayE